MDTVGQDDDGDDSEVERRLEQLLLRIDADDVTEEQMNWTKIGTCLHFQLAPVLRKYIQPVVKNMYETLKSSSGIDCQTKDNFLVAYPPRTDENYTQIQDSYKLHYKNINNNNSKFAQHKERYVYSVTDEVELSKLFLPKQKETNYKDFERISLSSVLNLIINVSDFRHPLQLDARKVRDKIRNRWAHPEEHAWNGEQLSKFFAEIQQCIGSLQLPEEDHSKILYQVLCLRYCETRNTLKKDIRNLIEDVIYTRISSGDLQRCPECLRRDIVSQNQLDNNNLEINDTNPEMVMKLWVRVIKLYSWLKDEMKKPHALCVAAQLLSPDDAEVIHNSMSRLMAVDRLLKYILRHETVYLCKFLKISDLHMKNALKRKMEKVLPSKAEIEDCVRRNNQQIPDSNSFSLAEADKKSLLCKINTMKTIDFLNNGFLERFFVSLAEHDNVCEYLHKSEFANGASCLIDIVERRSYHVMYLLCHLLEQRQETGYIVERLGLRKKYCQARDGVTTETDDAEIGIYSTLQRKDNIDLKPTDFKVTGLELGSIIFRLCPRSTRSWEDLKRMCLSGDIINMLNNTFLDREILKWMSVDEPRLLLTIYSEESFDSTDKAQREAILKLNLISEESDSTELGCGSEDNPLQSNVDILCEELEINDDLIKLLKIKELVPSNISLELEQTHSRAAEIRCLLQKISFPEEGYEVIKEYLKYSNTYAYQALLQTENTSRKRKLTYKCEACLRHRADSGTQTSAKDIDTEDLHEKCADTIHKAWKITWSKCFFEQHDHGGEQNKPADKATSTGDGLWSAEISEDSGVETVEIRQISDEKTSKGKSANLDMDSKEDPTRVMSKEEIDVLASQELADLKTRIPDMDMPLQTPAQEEEFKQTPLGMDTSLGTRHGTSDECYDPYCDSCYEGGGKNSKAYGFCTNCVQFLCTDCYKVHGQLPATRHHDVVYGEDMPKSQADKPPRFDSCEVHPKLLKDQFCCDHKTLLCSVCSSSEHNTCFIKNVEKVCTIVDSSDTCALYDRISSLQETLKSTLPYVDKVMMELTDQEKTMLHDAQKVYDQIIEQANTSHVSIKNEIQTRCQSKISRLSHLREKVSDMSLNLDTPLTELKKIKTKPIDTKLFLKLQENVIYTQNIAKELQDLYGPLKIVSLSFIPSQSSQEMLHSSFTLGRIQKSESVPSGIDVSVPDIMFPVSALKQTTANPNAGQRPPPQNPRGAMASPLLSKPTQPLPKMKVTKKGTFNIKLKDDLNTCCITGISISNDKRILMTDYDNSKVKMFSHDMKYLSSVSVPEKPRDIAVISDDEAVVTADRQSLVILDIRGSQPSIRTRTELSYDIRGICKRNNKLVVTSPGSNPASVKLIDQTGKVHWTVSYDPQGQSLFSLPWYVSSHGGERSSTVIVTDQSDDKLTLLNVDAKEIIGRHLTMKSPFGVTSDSTGNVYVCYLGSHEVVLLSGDLSKQTILLSAQEGLKANPQAIAYDDDTHHLIVSYHSHDKVHRFKLS